MKKHIFWIILATNFIVAATMTMIMPFLSLYIETFGNYSASYVQTWAGLIFAATFISSFIMSPIWGRVADRIGHKPIMVINCFGLAVSVFLMSYVQSVEQFFILRLLMGVVTGFIPTSMAFVSKHTQKEIAGKTLGTLQMGSVGGSLFGPIIGGSIVDAVGFTYTFLFTAVSISVVALIVWLTVKQPPIVRIAKSAVYSSRNVIWAIFHHKTMLAVMIITSLIQIGNFSIQPLLSLYVADLTHATNIAMLAGFAFSATGLGNLLFSRFFGRLADKYGYEKLLVYLLFASVLTIIPQALVTSLPQLIILRFLFGVFTGGLIPITTALIRRDAPLAVQGEVMGYNQSFRFFGNMIGPIFGGFLSGIIGIAAVFYINAVLFFIAFLLIVYVRKRKDKSFDEIMQEHSS